MRSARELHCAGDTRFPITGLLKLFNVGKTSALLTYLQAAAGMEGRDASVPFGVCDSLLGAAGPGQALQNNHVY